MVKVDLNLNTLSVLVAGVYCTAHGVDSIAIPQSVWITIAEKLEYFLPSWNYEIISFEEWIEYCLMIYPKQLLEDETIEEMQNTTLYWEYPNGNAILSISMDIGVINNG